jgi:hypothetical protein
MLWGVDSAVPHPEPGGLVALGYSFACGYVGGRAANTWAADDWARHVEAGLLILPIWVSPAGVPSYKDGRADGARAIAAMSLVFLKDVIALDVEDGAIVPEYIRGFVRECHVHYLSVVLYGTAATLRANSFPKDQVDSWWLADWVTPGADLPVASADWSMWQYAQGPRFDRDVARDDFSFATYVG